MWGIVDSALSGQRAAPRGNSHAPGLSQRIHRFTFPQQLQFIIHNSSFIIHKWYCIIFRICILKLSKRREKASFCSAKAEKFAYIKEKQYFCAVFANCAKHSRGRNNRYCPLTPPEREQNNCGRKKATVSYYSKQRTTASYYGRKRTTASYYSKQRTTASYYNKQRATASYYGKQRTTASYCSKQRTTATHLA